MNCITYRRNYRQPVIPVKEAGYSPNSREVVKAIKLRLLSDLVDLDLMGGKVRGTIPGRQKGQVFGQPFSN